ncbi:MAG: oxygen-independent coproporphyrinogen III oxidase [Agathobacter sp.]|nr:oxygen-independent coproporphyrinogen III oxidase [Agathobacter sp.]
MRNLQIYVHIPFCVKKCNYCDFLSFSCDERTQLEYADALIREIKVYGTQMKDYIVSTIYIGGGTPSWLDEDKLLEILDTIYKNFKVSEDAEISMECNPGTVTAGKLAKYRMAGINRLSIGLQSADDEELKILGRIHTFEQFVKTYELARNAGFANINVDLISGIPYQTTEKFLKTLQKVVWLKPNHISAYSLIIEKGTPFYETYKFDAVKQEAGMPTEVLPTEDEVYRIYKMTQEYLERAGYQQYEISNFAQQGFECVHNIGYWTRENYLGLGLGAASLIENVRYTNTTDLYEYIDGTKDIQEKCFAQEDAPAVAGMNLHEYAGVVSRKAQMEEFMFLGLRMTEGITRERFFREFGISIEGVYLDVLEKLKAEDLIDTREGRIVLTEKGADLSNYVLAQFLID